MADVEKNIIAKDSQTLADIVSLKLRQDILSGKMIPGSKINEAEAAQAFGVSCGPLREALNRLVSMGLLEYRSNSGVRVIKFEPKKLIELYEMREYLVHPEIFILSLNSNFKFWFAKRTGLAIS